MTTRKTKDNADKVETEVVVVVVVQVEVEVEVKVEGVGQGEGEGDCLTCFSLLLLLLLLQKFSDQMRVCLPSGEYPSPVCVSCPSPVSLAWVIPLQRVYECCSAAGTCNPNILYINLEGYQNFARSQLTLVSCFKFH